MNNERVLTRVEDDLAHGHTYVAIQRLTTLVQTDPMDLDARSRLAAIHLDTGNLVAAGRWGYLEEEPNPDGFAAFESAYPHPRARLDALRRVDSTMLGPLARARVLALETALKTAPALSKWGEPLTHAPQSRVDGLVPAAIAVVVSLLVGLACIVFVVGVVTSVNAVF